MNMLGCTAVKPLSSSTTYRVTTERLQWGDIEICSSSLPKVPLPRGGGGGANWDASSPYCWQGNPMKRQNGQMKRHPLGLECRKLSLPWIYGYLALLQIRLSTNQSTMLGKPWQGFPKVCVWLLLAPSRGIWWICWVLSRFPVEFPGSPVSIAA